MIRFFLALALAPISVAMAGDHEHHDAAAVRAAVRVQTCTYQNYCGLYNLPNMEKHAHWENHEANAFFPAIVPTMLGQLRVDTDVKLSRGSQGDFVAVSFYIVDPNGMGRIEHWPKAELISRGDGTKSIVIRSSVVSLSLGRAQAEAWLLVKNAHPDHPEHPEHP